MKKVLVTGSSGLLGSNLVFGIKDKYELFGVYKSCPSTELANQLQADLSKAAAVKQLMDSIKPEVIVHCAALVDVDLCEKNYTFAHKENAVSTKNLVNAAGPGTRFIYMSTDSVFDGKIGNYTENYSPSPVNNYAKTKLEGESFVEQNSKNYVIIRTSFFGWNRVKSGGLAEWIINSLIRKESIQMFTDVIFSPLCVNTLAGYIDKFLNNDFTGRINLGSTTSMSKYGFGIKMAKLFNLNDSLIKPISIDAFDFKAKRPKNTTLDATKASTLFGRLPTLESELVKFHTEKRPSRWKC